MRYFVVFGAVALVVSALLGIAATYPNLQLNASNQCTQTVDFTGQFSVDSPTLYVDKTNNRVGIAKNNPTTALDVTGTVTATAFAGALTGNVTGTASANPTISSGTLVAMPLTNTKKIGDIYIDTGNANAYVCCATGADTTGWKQVNN